MTRWPIGLLASILALSMLAAVTGCGAKSGARVELRDQTYRVELAETPEAQARGLMFRDSMPEDHGMLFIFPDTAMRGFWMKNCKFPQDMLFFDEDMRLVSVQKRVPPCHSESCPSYSSGAPAKYVLELNAGQADRLGVQSGDVFKLVR